MPREVLAPPSEESRENAWTASLLGEHAVRDEQVNVHVK